MYWLEAMLVFLTAAFLGSTTYAQAIAEVPKDSAIRFARDVAPILRDKCITCHGRTMRQAGLRLDSRFEMLRGGKSGPAITENGDVDSLLIRRISGSEAGMRMPPPGPLPDKEIEILRAWVRAGAPWDAEATFDQAHAVTPGARKLFEALRHGQLSAEYSGSGAKLDPCSRRERFDPAHSSGLLGRPERSEGIVGTRR
jgi:hypothetical protein